MNTWIFLYFHYSWDTGLTFTRIEKKELPKQIGHCSLHVFPCQNLPYGFKASAGAVLSRSSTQAAIDSSSVPHNHRCCSSLSLPLYIVQIVWDKAGSSPKSMFNTQQNTTRIYSSQIAAILQTPTDLKTRILKEYLDTIYHSFVMPAVQHIHPLP